MLRMLKFFLSGLVLWTFLCSADEIHRLDYYYVASHDGSGECYMHAMHDELRQNNSVVCKGKDHENHPTMVWFTDNTLIRNKLNASYVLTILKDSDHVAVQMYDAIGGADEQRLDFIGSQFIRTKKDLKRVITVRTNNPNKFLYAERTESNIPKQNQAWKYHEAGGSAPDPDIITYTTKTTTPTSTTPRSLADMVAGTKWSLVGSLLMAYL